MSRRPGHRARRRALGARPSLDLPQRGRPRAGGPPGLVPVHDPRGRFIGQALLLPRLRDPAPAARADRPRRWTPPGGASGSRRAPRRRDGIDATAYRLVHGEGDGLPSLVVDRYDRWLVVQILSAGLETMRDADRRRARRAVPAPRASCSATTPPCAGARACDEAVALARGTVPREIEVREGGSPLPGRALGRPEDRRLPRSAPQPPAGRRAARRRAAGRSTASPTTAPSPSTWPAAPAAVLALDVSRDALDRGARQRRAQRPRQHRVARGGRLRDAARLRPGARAVRHHRPRPAGVRQEPRARCRPRSAATARSTSARCAAWRPGGILLTASCSFHVRLPEFLAMLAEAAARQRPAHPPAPRSWARARTTPRCSPFPRPATSRARCSQAE